jgi:hypothetical protein
MNDLEVRYLWGTCSHGLVGGSVTRQEAIPWCTTHKMSVLANMDDVCHEGFIQDQAEWPVTCVVSTRGSDHKWWEDNVGFEGTPR